MHAAARDLGVSQPAMSRLLGEAEALVGGCLLFERTRHGSRATPGGAAVVAQARVLLRGFERLDESAAHARAPIRLGCIARAMHTLMPALLQRVYPAAPGPRAVGEAGLRFHLTEGSSTALYGSVMEGRLDFAILRAVGSDRGDRDIVVDRLYDERTVIICAASNRDLPGATVSLARLAQHDWVLPDAETASRVGFDRFWTECGLPAVRPLIEARSFETNLALVASTRFLSIAPESVARRHQRSGAVRILRSRPALPLSPVVLVYPRDTGADPGLSAFRSAVYEAAAQARIALRRRDR